MKAKLVWNFSGEGALKNCRAPPYSFKGICREREGRGDRIWNPATNQVYRNRFCDCSE